jgi:cytochrome c-type biogenesis protein CcmH/NrfF
MERPWVMSKEGRASRLGTELNCVRCDEVGEAVAQKAIEACRSMMLKAYEEGPA